MKKMEVRASAWHKNLENCVNLMATSLHSHFVNLPVAQLLHEGKFAALGGDMQFTSLAKEHIV